VAKKKRAALIRMPVEKRIRVIRGVRVILDEDLASLYGVSVKRLNEQVKRNIKRFPIDFMFRLTSQEAGILKSQIATSRSAWGGRRKLPLAFTEHGAIMAANVLHTKLAREMRVFVVRAFVRLREILATNKHVAEKLSELERRLGAHDEAISQIVEELGTLMRMPLSTTAPIGFRKTIAPVPMSPGSRVRALRSSRRASYRRA